MTVVGVSEAAQRLRVSPRRVRQMISDEDLPARRVGRAWAIEEGDIRSATRRRPPHRPWKPASAWAVLAAADCSLSSSLAPYQRHRARKRLGAGLANILANLSERARRRTFYAHPADVVRIVSEPGAVRTAASAAEELGIDLVGDGPAEAYVRQSLFNRIASAYHIEERAERPNMVLRIVADADWPFPEGTVTAPRAVAAVDLLESHDQRSQRAGSTLLQTK